MKKEWHQTMKQGTEEQKAEQWQKFGDKMIELGSNMKNFKPEADQAWDACFQRVKKEKREKKEKRPKSERKQKERRAKSERK